MKRIEWRKRVVVRCESPIWKNLLCWRVQQIYKKFGYLNALIITPAPSETIPQFTTIL
jgi:hypothetical protein